jgi:hypothetical protein
MTASAITWEQYCEIDAVNVSRLLELGRSPRHYQQALATTRKETEALRLGRLIHRAILEPDLFHDEVAVWEGERRAGAAWEEFRRDNPGKVYVRRVDHELCMALSAAVREHPVAGEYLARRGLSEHTIKWKHTKTGTLCKSRLDWVADEEPLVLDLKSTTDATPLEFGKSAARYEYHVRAAFYADAYEAKFGVVPAFILVALEKEPPYSVACYRVPEDAIDAGRRVYEKLLARLETCLASSSWPGICDDQEIDLVLPPWASGMMDELDLVVGEERVSL